MTDTEHHTLSSNCQLSTRPASARDPALGLQRPGAHGHLDFLRLRGRLPGTLLAQLLELFFSFESRQALLEYPRPLGGVAEELDVILACALSLTWVLNERSGPEGRQWDIRKPPCSWH